MSRDENSSVGILLLLLARLLLYKRSPHAVEHQNTPVIAESDGEGRDEEGNGGGGGEGEPTDGDRPMDDIVENIPNMNCNLLHVNSSER